MHFDMPIFDKWPVIRRIIIAFFIIFWTLFMAELYLRAFKPQAMLPRYVVATDYGIRGNMANQSYLHNTPDYQVSIRTNSKGIRTDEEIPYEKPAGIKRIVVLGDSFGMGYGVNIEDSLLTVMSNKLAQDGIENQIVNLSVSGFGTAEELIQLKEEGVKYHPDIVLLLWHTTDFDENLRSKLFMLDNDKLVRKNKFYLPGVKIREFLFKYSLYRWLAGSSHLYNWARERLAVAIKKLLSSTQSGSNSVHKAKKSEIKDSPSKIFRVSYEEALAATLLNEIRGISKKNNAKLIVLDIPLKITRQEFKSTFPFKAISNIDDFIVVNPIDNFMENLKKNPDKLLYWERSHGHFTPDGCKIVGNLLAEKIVDMNILSK